MRIVSQTVNEKYREGYDKVFSKRRSTTGRGSSLFDEIYDCDECGEMKVDCTCEPKKKRVHARKRR